MKVAAARVLSILFVSFSSMNVSNLKILVPQLEFINLVAKCKCRMFLLTITLLLATAGAQTPTHTNETNYNGVLTGVDVSQLKVWTNGNDWGHISRQNVHTIFPGFTGGILVRYMPWWCN